MLLERQRIEDRLTHEADQRKEKRERLKRENEMNLMKDCSFKPKLMTNSNSAVNMKRFNE